MTEISRKETSSRMSKIVCHNNIVYLCGQVGEASQETVVLQTESMLAKVEGLLQLAGSDKKHILSATVYLRDMKDFTAMNSVWDKWVPEGYAPARACVEARIAHPDLLVEISVIAAKRQE
ncbi:RidA family protein [Desulforhopalus singaporensis]|uniref:Enamine deaminase RidA, house cleaning of reactive enamine intermediates, YjgF/YER057c/UK114 family n=1 Tax=Desulforhopalus singaporensis TaxID=91360 RepID=A0A1H0R179_9BACT|nr:RidA family protein [Desulforhopalus singaporensis]SDP23170.1 Enamine deaminase RidA, house cleaning of reactive enamine intermediates, YjgF/YER057c/UK114 family [Desulforhopalus singaporensis]